MMEWGKEDFRGKKLEIVIDDTPWYASPFETDQYIDPAPDF